jgi:hypothetical protein
MSLLGYTFIRSHGKSEAAMLYRQRRQQFIKAYM